MKIQNKLIYPKHNHPHGINDIPKNDYRIWVCEECKHVFSDSEIREDALKGWGHMCLLKDKRCESHLEPFIPE